MQFIPEIAIPTSSHRWMSNGLIDSTLTAFSPFNVYASSIHIKYASRKRALVCDKVQLMRNDAFHRQILTLKTSISRNADVSSYLDMHKYQNFSFNPSTIYRFLIFDGLETEIRYCYVSNFETLTVFLVHLDAEDNLVASKHDLSISRQCRRKSAFTKFGATKNILCE